MRLRRGLRRGVADVAGDDDRSIAAAPTEPGGAEALREAGDEADGGRRAERGLVVLVHLVAQAGVADVVQPQELIEAVGATVRQHQRD